MKHLTILDKNQIEEISLLHLRHLCIEYEQYFSGNAGGEPYKLYSFISNQYNNITILDIGSYFGNSAIALSDNKTNTIISYDIQEHGQTNIVRKNISWKLQEFREDNSIDYKNIPVILIDVDPHDGIQEIEMVNFLREKQWSGLLILDDIHLNENMNDFWQSFKEPKEDLTSFGHHSGTGVVYF